MNVNRWSTGTKRLVLAAALVVFGILVYLVWPLMPVIALAAVLAYLLMPPVEGLVRAGMPRFLATILIFLLLITFLVLVAILLLPALVRSATTVDLHTLITALAANATTLLDRIRVVQVAGFTVDLSPVVDPLRQQLATGVGDALPEPLAILGTLTGWASRAIGTVLDIVVNFVLILITALYIVLDAPAIRRGVWSFVPENSRVEVKVLQARLNQIWASFFRGQLLLGLTVGVATTIGGLIIGLPGALWLGLLAGVLEVVPNLGPILAAIPALAVAFIQGSAWIPVSPVAFMFIVAGMYILIQQLENNLLVPRILGSAVGLPPVVVLLGAIIGASVAGLLGVFLAAPVIASVALGARYTYNKMLDKPPFESLRSVTPEMIALAEAAVLAEEMERQAALPALALQAAAVEDALSEALAEEAEEAQLNPPTAARAGASPQDSEAGAGTPPAPESG